MNASPSGATPKSDTGWKVLFRIKFVSENKLERSFILLLLAVARLYSKTRYVITT